MISEIFKYLSPEDLLNCAKVNKNWRKFTDNKIWEKVLRKYLNKHTNNAYQHSPHVMYIRFFIGRNYKQSYLFLMNRKYRAISYYVSDELLFNPFDMIDIEPVTKTLFMISYIITIPVIVLPVIITLLFIDFLFYILHIFCQQKRIICFCQSCRIKF